MNMRGANMQLFNSDLALYNSMVRLRSIEEEDISKFSHFTLDSRIWKYFACKMETESDMIHYIQDALKQLKSG